MNFSISPEVSRLFPELAVGLLRVDGLSNGAAVSQIESLLRAEESRQKELLSAVELPSLPEIRVWRDAYKRFGSDPRDYRSSIEALLRRCRGGAKPLPLINPLVDLYNYVSIKYHLPIGAEDLDKVAGDIRLALADGTEEGLALGAAAPERCETGEVVYKDDVGFMCRRWNWREADRTKIDARTTRAVVVVDFLPGAPRPALDEAMSELEELLRSLLGARTRSDVVTAETSSKSLMP